MLLPTSIGYRQELSVLTGCEHQLPHCRVVGRRRREERRRRGHAMQCGWGCNELCDPYVPHTLTLNPFTVTRMTNQNGEVPWPRALWSVMEGSRMGCSCWDGSYLVLNNRWPHTRCGNPSHKYAIDTRIQGKIEWKPVQQSRIKRSELRGGSTNVTTPSRYHSNQATFLFFYQIH